MRPDKVDSPKVETLIELDLTNQNPQLIEAVDEAQIYAIGGNRFTLIAGTYHISSKNGKLTIQKVS